MDGVRCAQKYCNANLGVIQAGQAVSSLYSARKMENASSTLISFTTQCCYGLTSTGQCIQNYTANDCGKRFLNRGWSVCCAFGLYYSVQQKACLDTCAGYVILDMLCLSNNSYLSLNGAPGSPPTESSSTCNGLTLPFTLPVCCPKNFYLDGLYGCKYCAGTIHKTSLFQACCT